MGYVELLSYYEMNTHFCPSVVKLGVRDELDGTGSARHLEGRRTKASLI
jgi:hypothetical protein